MKEAIYADLYSITSLTLWLVLAAVILSKSFDLFFLIAKFYFQIAGLKNKC